MTKGDSPLHKVVECTPLKINSDFSGASTYTTLFLIPAFNIYLDQSLYGMFVNSYIDDHELSHVYERPLFLLIKTGLHNEETRPVYDKVHTTLTANPSYVYHYTVGCDGGDTLLMYVFECPQRFTTDYDLFRQGRYSEFSEEYKKRFNKNVPNAQGTYVESPIYGVLYKTDTLRKEIESRLSWASSQVNSKIRLDKNQELFGLPVDRYEIFRKPLPTN